MPLTAEQYQEYLRRKSAQQQAAAPPVAPAPDGETNLWGSFKVGLRESPTGIAIRGLPQPSTEDYDFWEKVAKGIGSSVDPISLALFALGGGIGGAAAKQLGTKAATQLLLRAGAKKAVQEFGIKAAQTGITNASMFALHGAGAEGIKQAVSGDFDGKRVLTEGLKGAAIGAATGPAAGIPGAGLVGKAGRFGGEAAAMTGAGAFVEGQKPTAEDFLVNAAVLGAGKVGAKAVGKALPKPAEAKAPGDVFRTASPYTIGKTTRITPKEKAPVTKVAEGAVDALPVFEGDIAAGRGGKPFVRPKSATPAPVVVRMEEPGTIPDPSKPQGLYLNRDGQDTGVEPEMTVRHEYRWIPVNPLDVGSGGKPFVHKRFQIFPGVDRAGSGSAGIEALRKLIPDSEFSELASSTKAELVRRFSAERPDVDWNRYYDSYEMLEAYGGIKAREAGYDAIVAPDELVALKETAISPVPAGAPPAQVPNPFLKSATKIARPIIKLGDDRIERIFDPEASYKGESGFHTQVFNWIDKSNPLGKFRRRIAKQGAELLDEVDPQKTMRTDFATADVRGAQFYDTHVMPILRGVSDKDLSVIRDTAAALSIAEHQKVDPKRFTAQTLRQLGTSQERIQEALLLMDNYTLRDGRSLRSVMDAIGKRETGATWLNAVETRGLAGAEKLFGAKGYYFPLYRQSSGREIAASTPNRPMGAGDLLADPIQMISGRGDIKIEDPLLSILRQSMTMRRYQAQQRAIGQMLDISTKMGGMGDLISVAKEGAGRDNTVKFEGERYKVDPEIYASLASLSSTGHEFISKWASIPTRVLRRGVTIAPEFWLRNSIRDVWSATIMSKYGFTPLDFARGLSSAIKKDEWFKRWVEAGGPSATWISMDKNMLHAEFAAMMRSGKMDTLKYIARHPLDVSAMVSELAENATRIGEFRKGVQAGVSDKRAAFASRDLSVDFRRSGRYGQIVNQLVPFWNANINGWEKFIRETNPKNLFTSDPVRRGQTQKVWLKAGLGITAPSVALTLANMRDPRWKDIPEWQKNMFWIVMTDDHIWRIPKPFELGMIFGSMPERIVEAAAKDDPTQFDDMWKMFDRSGKDIVPDPVTDVQAWAPLAEVMMNKNTFTGGPIVPRSEAEKPAKYQKAKYTKRTFVELGERLGYSPAKLEYLWDGYTGTMGRYAADISDVALNALDPADKVKPPKETWADVPFIRGFIVRHPTGGGRLVDQYYDLMAENEGKYKVRQDLRGRERDSVARVHRIGLKYQKLIRAAYDRADAAENSATMTPEVKRERIDNEYYRINRLAEQALAEIRKGQ